MSRRRKEQDFRDEIASHLQHEADRVAAQDGASPAEAAARAHRAFGNITAAEERFYESRRWLWLDQLRADLGYALRSLRSRPGFALIALLTLGLGIGINTAVFTLFYSVIGRPLPVRDPGQIYNIYQDFSGNYQRQVNGMRSLVAWPEYQDYVRGNRAFTGLAAYGDIDLSYAGSRDGTVRGQLVSCNYFPLLGTAILPGGRSFAPDECAGPGDGPVAVISHRLWQEAFGGDSSALGVTIEVNRTSLTVIGIAEPGFAGIELQPAEVWIPMTQQPVIDHARAGLLDQDVSWLFMVGRLVPPATLAQARRELSVVARAADVRHPGRTTGVVLAPGALLNFPEARRDGGLLAGAIGMLGLLVMVMVCANLMNLLLARGLARRREIAIRLALGASRARVLTQLLTESLLLGLTGGAIGLLLAGTMPWLVRRMLPPGLIQVDLAVGLPVLSFTLLLTVGTAAVFGLIPAMQSTRLDLASAVKGGASLLGGRLRPTRLRSLAVGVQVTGSAFLLLLASLLLRGAQRQASTDPGFQADGVVAFALNFGQLGYDSTRARGTMAQIVDRVAALPGVSAVALTQDLPLLSEHGEGIRRIDGRELDAPLSLAVVSPSYFDVLGTRLIRGRAFTSAEAARTVDRPAVISESMARRFWPDQDPLGHQFEVEAGSYRITGVAQDAHTVTLAELPSAFAYLAAPVGDPRGLQIVARAGDLAAIELAVPALARTLDPALVVKAERLSRRLSLARKPAQISSLATSTLGGLALLLALMGIYGVVGYAVTQRRQELAVRLALGARPGQVIALMMRRGLPAAAGGLAVGTVLALAATQVLRTVFADLRRIDPAAFGGMMALLIGAITLATWLPARRASAVQPASTLRVEE